MEKEEESKVVIDTSIAEKIPTVVIPPPSSSSKTEEKGQLSKSPSLLASFLKQLVNFFLDFLETIVVALSIFVVVYLFLVQPHEVKGSSMEPNFQNNEYILTDKISYRFKEPQRGDVIIFKSPKNPEVDYIKRVIGLPQEKIKVEKGKIFINDKELEEKYLEERTFLFPGSFMQEGVAITVPAGEYFVLGDNRDHSSDSREFGPISQKLIIGRAFMRYWPISTIGLIPEVKYQPQVIFDESP